MSIYYCTGLTTQVPIKKTEQRQKCDIKD